MHIYRANILYTSTPQAFRILRRGYIVVDDEGYIVHVARSLPEPFPNQLHTIPTQKAKKRILFE